MATIHREIPIESTVDAAWDKLSDVGNVHEMLSIVTESSVDGDKRVAVLADGSRLEELILSIDGDLHRVAYAVVSSPLDIEFHAASMSLEADGEMAKFAWTTDVKPDAAADGIAELIDGETHSIKAFFAGVELGGLCAASLAIRGTEFPGDPTIQSIHDGRTYWFGSVEAKGFFDADPDAMVATLAKMDR